MSGAEPDHTEQTTPRPRGRPRREINLEQVADAVAELFDEVGFEGVSIPATAEKLSVSRATLYRTVPTKEDLLGILLERCNRDITEAAQAIVAGTTDPQQRLHDLVRLLIDAAVRMRHYLPLFFGGGEVPSEVFARWRTWRRDFESLWVGAVTDAMEASVLEKDDPVITTRLILGMCLWICRWYRPHQGYDPEAIAEAALRLLHNGPATPGTMTAPPATHAHTPRRRTPKTTTSPSGRPQRRPK